MLPLVVAAVWEGYLQLVENSDRWETYRAARAAADAVGKPLLNIGCPRKWPLKYPCGDVCLDLDANRLALCQSSRPTFADVRAIPFPDGYFGAALCTHVLEHLASVDDAQQALSELLRVSSGSVFLASPSRLSFAAWANTEHNLWIDQATDGRITITAR